MDGPKCSGSVKFTIEWERLIPKAIRYVLKMRKNNYLEKQQIHFSWWMGNEVEYKLPIVVHKNNLFERATFHALNTFPERDWSMKYAGDQKPNPSLRRSPSNIE